jgi:7-cyano-7-deazaguanine synthase
MKEEMLAKLPDTGSAVVVLSGGLDSTIAARLAVEKYGANNVYALNFNYGQKQKVEIVRAIQIAADLQIKIKLVKLDFLHDFSMGFSANVDPDIKVPHIKEVLGDPQPKTYVPNRNAIMMHIAAAYAEQHNIKTIILGIQTHDLYGYYDTSARFIETINSSLAENRKHKIQIVTPFANSSKCDELKLLEELDGNVELAGLTITCYNPIEDHEHCGECPSCSERILNFAKFGVEDPALYAKKIDWERLFEKYKE